MKIVYWLLFTCKETSFRNWLITLRWIAAWAFSRISIISQIIYLVTYDDVNRRIIHQPGSSAVGLNLKDTDNLSPSTPKDSYRTRQSKKNSSRCSIFGINGKINPLSDSDDFGEEVIYSQESPKMEESFKDFNRDLDWFVEYRSPFTRKETLPIKKSI